ncbi:MAG: hypothetical protein K0R43_1689 [Pseudoduganella sp.]|jgi:hypothetical protein|nr:hypothetical protein [Pseudoduganella sp.]
MVFRAAFYKGTRPGLPGVYNRVVRWWTRSKHSHMELIFSDGLSASSSFEDGGVRFKRINYSSDNWDFRELPQWMEAPARRYFEDRKGWRYDLLGQLHFIISPIRGAVRKLFCSAAGLGALMIEESYRYSPGEAYFILGCPAFTERQPTIVNFDFSKP